jgi:hypothetical protein
MFTMRPQAGNVEERISEICSGGPGDDLATELRTAGEAGCRVWHLADGVVVPRLGWTSEGTRPRFPRSKLPPIVLTAMETGHPSVGDRVLEDKTACTRLSWLSAAAFRDVLGLSEQEVAERLGYTVDEPRHWADADGSRSARKAAKQGRLLLAHLGAWPWWCCRPVGEAMPQDWWLEPEIHRALAAWLGDPGRSAAVLTP